MPLLSPSHNNFWCKFSHTLALKTRHWHFIGSVKPSKMTFSVMTLSIMTLSKKGLYVTHNISDIQHK
jgi:hypothetical protein